MRAWGGTSAAAAARTDARFSRMHVADARAAGAAAGALRVRARHRGLPAAARRGPRAARVGAGFGRRRRAGAAAMDGCGRRRGCDRGRGHMPVCLLIGNRPAALPCGAAALRPVRGLRPGLAADAARQAAAAAATRLSVYHRFITAHAGSGIARREPLPARMTPQAARCECAQEASSLR